MARSKKSTTDESTTEAPKPRGVTQTTMIELAALNKRSLDVYIVGDTPLIVHAWSKKAREEMLAKQMKRSVPAKPPKDPMQDFKDSLYQLEDGRYGFPSVAFKAAAVTACTSLSTVTKVAARQCFHVLGETTMREGAFQGLRMRENLVPIYGSEPQMREDMVRIGMGTADLRYRGEFFPWMAKLTVHYNENVLSLEQITNLFNTAGFAVGIAEWRPEKDGQYGLFHVADHEEQLEVQKIIDAAIRRLKIRVA